MSDKIGGSFTIREVLEMTRKYYSTRYDNKDRDKVRFIKVRSIKYFSKLRPSLPVVRYEVVSRSYPSYGPYLKDKRGRKRRSQRSVSHFYDSTFVFGEEGLSLDTYKWKASCGSMRKWKKAPQNQIGTIRKKTLETWKRMADRRFKTKKEAKAWVDKKIKQHKKRARYVDDGDYNAQELGINGDFIFRCAYAYNKHNHLDGRNYFGNKPSKLNKRDIVFFTKHQIILIEQMLKQGLLK